MRSSRDLLRTIVAAALGGLLILNPASFAAWPIFHATDLGTFGRTSSEPAAIDDNGVIAVTAITSLSSTQVYLYSNGVATPLPSFGAPYAQAMNEVGQVVCLDFNSKTSFVTSTGGYTVLPNLITAGTNYALSINNAGDVSGYGKSTTGRDHAYLYHNGTMTDVGAMVGASADFSQGNAVNNNGVMVGTNFVNGGFSRPFTYDGSTVTDLNRSDYVANEINDYGQIIGSTSNSLPDASRGFYFDGTTYNIIPSLSDKRGDALGMNDHGFIVGRSILSDGSEHAFVYTVNDGVADLNSLVAGLPANVVLTRAVDVNNSDQIAVIGTVNGIEHTFLVEVPEPVCIAWLTGPLALCLRRRRLRG